MPNRTASRPSTSYTSRPRTGISAVNNQDIICALTESRGVSPIVGIAFLNLTSVEAILCQISDNQSYVRTVQKLSVYEPSLILVPAYAHNASSKLHGCIEENLSHVSTLQQIDRRYFSETAGSQHIQQLAFTEDIDAIAISTKGYFFTLCCFAAVSSSKPFMLIASLTLEGYEIRRHQSGS